MTRVALVGTGAMGSRIARRLCGAGHDVTVWNRSPDKAHALVEFGATAVGTPREAASRCEVIITMVANPEALRAVSEGRDGLAAGARTGAIVIEMSTVGPPAIERLASHLPPGVELVDAPVLGSIDAAQGGSLKILAGGEEMPVDTVEPLLSELGTVLRVGPLGAGAAAKLVANASLFGTLAVLGEVFALAQAAGLSREAAVDVLALTPVGDQLTRRLPSMESGSFPRRFDLSLARKDADLISALVVAGGIAAPVTAEAGRWMETAEREGRGDQDYTAVLGTILGQAGTGGARHITGDLGDEFRADGLIVDLDGVVWLGDHAIEGAVAALTALRDSGIEVVFLTNDPVASREQHARRLTAMGVPTMPADVFTAGTAAAAYLAGQPNLEGARTLVVGSSALRRELRQAGFELVTTRDAEKAAIVVVGFHNGFDVAELRAATVAVCSGAALYATGRDPFAPALDGRVPGTGAIVAAIETATGARATLTGKPEPHVFAMARARLAGCKRVAVVGDSIVSDVVGAKRSGLSSILVLSGATRDSDLPSPIARPDKVFASLSAAANWLIVHRK